AADLAASDAATVRTTVNSTMRGPGGNVILVALSRRLGKRALAARRTALGGIDELITRMIAASRTRSDGTDVLSWMLAARDEDGQAMSDTDVRDEVLTLLLAGHETSTNALSWAYLLLSEHPEAAATLHAELDRVLGGRLPTVADLAQLHWTRAVAD